MKLEGNSKYARNVYRQIIAPFIDGSSDQMEDSDNFSRVYMSFKDCQAQMQNKNAQKQRYVDALKEGFFDKIEEEFRSFISEHKQFKKYLRKAYEQLQKVAEKMKFLMGENVIKHSSRNHDQERKTENVRIRITPERESKRPIITPKGNS